LYQYGSGSGTFKSVVDRTPSAGVSLWDGELKGSLAASPSADGGARRFWNVPLVVSLLVASLSSDDSGADVVLVASLLLILEKASLACGGFFLDPTVVIFF
jgi:hypothetical protein